MHIPRDVYVSQRQLRAHCDQELEECEVGAVSHASGSCMMSEHWLWIYCCQCSAPGGLGHTGVMMAPRNYRPQAAAAARSRWPCACGAVHDCFEVSSN